jgi:hypothetical protein
MSYHWVKDQGRTREQLGERRLDKHTADKVRDALRARGIHAAAQALEYQQVDLATALRVLAEPAKRRQMTGC